MMPDAASHPNSLAGRLRPYFSRRYLRRWLALAALIILVWLLWPFLGLLGRLPEVGALLRLAPGLAGLDRPKTYLILVENEDELRATGGYITAAGTVTV